LYGQKILQVDPLREQVHRELIQLHSENGQRSLAVQQYEFCRQVLHEDLGIEPMAETQAAYRRIMGQSQPSSNAAMLYRGLPAEPILQQIDTLMKGLVQAQEQLQSLREQVASSR